MAMFVEGGAFASVWYMNPHDNRSLGSAIGQALKQFVNGTQVMFTFVDQGRADKIVSNSRKYVTDQVEKRFISGY